MDDRYSKSNKIYTPDEMVAFAVHCGATNASEGDIKIWEREHFPVRVNVARGEFVLVKARPDSVYEAKKHLAQVASRLTAQYGYNVVWEDDGNPPFLAKAITTIDCTAGLALSKSVNINTLNKD